MITTSSTTIDVVVDRLEAEDYLNSESASKIFETISTLTAQESTPWYVQAVIGVAAWLAAIPLIGFLTSLTWFVISATSLTVMGVIFCTIAVSLRFFVPKSLFVAQLTLVFSLAGQGLLIAGIGWATESPTVTALAVIILEIVLIAVYRGALHRFLSTLIIPAAILVLLFDLEIQEAIHVLIVALAVGCVVIWEYESYLAVNLPEDLYRPVGYGLAFSLLYVLTLSIVNVFGSSIVDVHYWWISSISLLLILLALEYLILTSEQLNSLGSVITTIIVGTAIVLLPTLQAPGIIAAVLIMALGLHRGNLSLLGLAAAFLALYLIIFYYNLDLTLLTKSLILIITGLAVITFRFVLTQYFETTGVEG